MSPENVLECRVFIYGADGNIALISQSIINIYTRQTISHASKRCEALAMASMNIGAN